MSGLARDISPRSIVALMVTETAFHGLQWTHIKRIADGFKCRSSPISRSTLRKIAHYLRERMPECSVILGGDWIYVQFIKGDAVPNPGSHHPWYASFTETGKLPGRHDDGRDLRVAG